MSHARSPHLSVAFGIWNVRRSCVFPGFPHFHVGTRVSMFRNDTVWMTCYAKAEKVKGKIRTLTLTLTLLLERSVRTKEKSIVD